MTKTDKQALRRLAKKATKQQWHAFTAPGTHAVHTAGDARCGDIIKWPGFDDQPNAENNAKFIAAANPVTVLALLDELEAADKNIAELEKSHAQVIHARDHYKRVASEGIQGIAESRTPTVKVPELSDEKFWIRFAGRLVFREETYRSAVINALDDAGIALGAGE